MKVIVFFNVYFLEYDLFCQELKVVYVGVIIGELKGKDVILDYLLVMSILLNYDGFFCFELIYEQVIVYLCKEVIILDVFVLCGYIFLIYKNILLGFVKNIGNWVNNFYLQEWCI